MRLRFTIRARLLILVASTLLAFAVVMVTSMYVTRDVLNQLTRVESQQIPKLELAPQMLAELTALRRSYQDAIAAHDNDALERNPVALRDRLLAHLTEAKAVLDPVASDEFRTA